MAGGESPVCGGGGDTGSEWTLSGSLTHLGINDSSGVIEVERECVVESPDQAESEGVGGEREVEGRGGCGELCGLQHCSIS